MWDKELEEDPRGNYQIPKMQKTDLVPKTEGDVDSLWEH